MRWILTHSNKWHAWPQGGRSTICGRVNIEHLRQSPAIKIGGEPVQGEGAVCTTCGRKTRYAPPAAQSVADANAALWLGHLRRHVTRVHVRAAKGTLEALAARLSLVGSPDTPEGLEVFEQVRVLLLTPVAQRTARLRRDGNHTVIMTLPHLKAALKALPPTRDAILHVTRALRSYRNITHRDPTADRFKADRVIETMLQIPAPDQYITHLNERGLPYLAAMFHPNTLDRAKKEPALRGLFAGSNEYWDNTADQLRIVSD